MRIKQSVAILAITGSNAKMSTPLDLGGIELHAGAFKKFVHFFGTHLFPVTKCVRCSITAT